MTPPIHLMPEDREVRRWAASHKPEPSACSPFKLNGDATSAFSTDRNGMQLFCSKQNVDSQSFKNVIFQQGESNSGVVQHLSVCSSSFDKTLFQSNIL
jgi:hypothetical protein